MSENGVERGFVHLTLPVVLVLIILHFMYNYSFFVHLQPLSLFHSTKVKFFNLMDARICSVLPLRQKSELKI